MQPIAKKFLYVISGIRYQVIGNREATVKSRHGMSDRELSDCRVGNRQ
jgi:hypothetical protein